MTDTFTPEKANGNAPIEPPRVKFGHMPNHSTPHEWAAWILTGMRDAELNREKPRPFSAWLSAACLHFAGMDAE